MSEKGASLLSKKSNEKVLEEESPSKSSPIYAPAFRERKNRTGEGMVKRQNQ
jgi:hypothetical protein